MFASIKRCLGVRTREHQTATHGAPAHHDTALPAVAHSSPRVLVRSHSRQRPFWWASALQRHFRPSPSRSSAENSPGTDTTATASEAVGASPLQSALA